MNIENVMLGKLYQNVVFHLCYAVQIELYKHHKFWYFKQIMII